MVHDISPTKKIDLLSKLETETPQTSNAPRRMKGRIRPRRSSSDMKFFKFRHFGDALSGLQRSWILMALLPFFILQHCLHCNAAPYDFCLEQLQRAAAADGNAAQLTLSEWQTAVSYLSGGAAEVDDTLLTTLQTTHASVSFTTNDASLQALCDDLMTAILAAQTVLDVQESKCFFYFQIGDADRNGFLQEQIEFPRFANQVSSQEYGFSTAYDALPVAVQNVFTDFADASTQLISIQGARSTDAATDEEKAALLNICYQTAIAVLASRSTTEDDSPVAAPVAAAPVPVPAAPAPAPTPGSSAGGSSSFASSFDDSLCFRMMAFSDVTRDNNLNADEYFNFCNRLITGGGGGGSPYSGGYADLPAVLQTNFDTLSAGTEQINVFGSKPGQTPSADDTTRLTEICQGTDQALQEAAQSAPAPSVPAPTPASPGSSPATTSGNAIPLAQCSLDLLFSDISRDSLLSDSEYVRFISRNSDKVGITDAFSSLTASLQDNFHALAASSGQIDIAGSRPGATPTAEQLANLEKICTDTGNALLGPAAPTLAPTKLTDGTGAVVYNSFVISNTVRLRADGLQEGPDRKALDEAYAEFINTVLANFTTTTERRNLLLRRGHSRRLPVTSVADPVLYVLRDAPCPSSVTGGNDYCQMVFGKFQVDFVAEPGPKVLVQKLTQATQEAIVPNLQTVLQTILPSTVILVEGASEPLTPDGSGDANGVDSNDNADGGHSSGVGKILAGLVFGAMLVSGCYWFYVRKNGGPPEWLDGKLDFVTDKLRSLMDAKFSGRNSGKKESINGTDDSENAYTGRFGLESAPVHTGAGIMPDDYYESSDEEDSGNEQGNENGSEEFSVKAEEMENGEVSKGKKNRFGILGKKNLAGVDNVGILEADDDFADGDDFVNYSFDEPLELKLSADIDPFGDWNGDNAWGTTAAAGPNKQEKKEIVLKKGLGNNSTENDGEEDETESDSSESGSECGSKENAVSGVGDAGHLEGLVDNGKWEGVMASAAKLDSQLNDDSETTSHSGLKSHTSVESSSHRITEGIDDIIDEVIAEEAAAEAAQSPIMTNDEIERRRQCREQVLELVKKAAPNEIKNVDTMLEKFEGREAELISTLQTLYARSNSQKRLKAVHRSKRILERNPTGLNKGGAEGSAVIAAASMMYGEEDPEESFRSGSGSYDDNDQGSYTGSYDSRDGSRRSGEGSYTGSRSGSYSYTGSRSGSYTGSRSGSYTGSRSGSYSEGSYTGTYDERAYSESQSHNNRDGGGMHDDQGSYTGSYTGSHSGRNSQEGSYSGAYDEQDGSHRSGSYNSQEGSYTGSYTGSRSGSRSNGSGKGSYVSPNGSYTGSYRSDSESHTMESQTKSFQDETSQASSYYYDEGG